MKKGNMNNGITLIALVVTIIMLLILAGVTIGIATNGTGLFDKAKEATEKYQNKQVEEEMQLAKYSNEIDSWTRAGGNYSETELFKNDNGINSGEVTFNNGHSINEFNSLRFLIGRNAACFLEVEYSSSSLNYLMTTFSTENNNKEDFIEFQNVGTYICIRKISQTRFFYGSY